MAVDEANDLTLRDYIVVVRRRQWLIVAVVILGTAAGLAYSLSETKVYSSTSEVLLRPSTAEQIFVPGDSQSSNRTQVDIGTEIQVMTSRSIRSAVARKLGYAPAVSITPKGQTDVVALEAQSGDPALAARAANTYAEVYIQTRRQELVDDLLAAAAEVQTKLADLDRQIAVASERASGSGSISVDARDAEVQGLLVQRSAYSDQLSQLQLASRVSRSGGARLVSEALTPGSPFRPTPRRTAAIAFAVALVLAIGLAFGIDYLDDSIRTKEDLERSSSLTTIGLIPFVPRWKNRAKARLVSIEEPDSAAAEAYRSLRTAIQFISIDSPVLLIQVTSTSAGEGKTTTITNLGVALARAGRRVVLVCCDLRRPRLHEFFELDNNIGFTSVLLGELPLNQALQPVPNIPNLLVLASGPPPPNPSELLSSKRAADIFNELRARADVVLIDTPPVLPVADAMIVAGQVDGTILVSSRKRGTRRGVRRAVELLQQVEARMIGAVLNGVSGDGYDSYGGQYGYGYRPQSTSKRSARRATPKYARNKKARFKADAGGPRRPSSESPVPVRRGGNRTEGR